MDTDAAQEVLNVAASKEHDYFTDPENLRTVLEAGMVTHGGPSIGYVAPELLHPFWRAIWLILDGRDVKVVRASDV